MTGLLCMTSLEPTPTTSNTACTVYTLLPHSAATPCPSSSPPALPMPPPPASLACPFSAPAGLPWPASFPPSDGPCPCSGAAAWPAGPGTGAGACAAGCGQTSGSEGQPATASSDCCRL